jgi:type IV pilus assembly protein PilW
MRAMKQSRRQRGLSLVELMIGITVGLFIVAAASMMTTNQLGDNRRLMLETQIQQDLRSAMDVVARDVRRAGYWDNASSSVWRQNNLLVQANPHSVLTSSGAASLQFEYDITDSNTGSGFRLQDDTLQMLVGNSWQAVTDPQTVVISSFSITVNEQEVSLTNFCRSCGGANCPKLMVRDVQVTLVGRATHDAQVIRQLAQTIRLPNDRLIGACPA